MGRVKLKTYQYDDKGNYLKTWLSYQDVRKEYYNDSKYPIFTTNKEYHVLPDGTYLVHERVGREKIRFYDRVENNEFCYRYNTIGSNKIVEVYNLLNEKIAEFINVTIASKLTGINQSTIYRAVNKNKGNTPLNSKKLYFKYKSI